MRPKDVIDWLLRSDIHFIICHLHQHTMPDWDITELITQYKRLETHNGFPTAENLRCPVFTQNKLKYLELIDQNAINNTFAMPLANYSAYKHLGPMYTSSVQQGLIALKYFMITNDYDNGFVVKYPFQTNKGLM